MDCGFIHQRAIITENSPSTCCLFVLGQILCLVFMFGWKWGQCLQPGGNPHASVVLASLLDTLLLIYSNTETFWQAPKFSLCDLAWWECGAFHLSKVPVAYMLCERKLLLSAVFLLLSFTVDSPVLTSMGAAWEINTSLEADSWSNFTACWAARKTGAKTTPELMTCEFGRFHEWKIF